MQSDLGEVSSYSNFIQIFSLFVFTFCLSQLMHQRLFLCFTLNIQVINFLLIICMSYAHKSLISLWLLESSGLVWLTSLCQYSANVLEEYPVVLTAEPFFQPTTQFLYETNMRDHDQETQIQVTTNNISHQRSSYMNFYQLQNKMS